MGKKYLKDKPLYLLLFLLNASSLALEVTLTRLFSYLYTHSYVYIVISISMAGIGFGVVLMRLLSNHRRKAALAVMSYIPVIATVIILLLQRTGGNVFLSLLLSLVIFMAVGMIQLLVFQHSNLPVKGLYAADLLGAATGSVLSFFLLNKAGGLVSLITCTLLITVIALLIHTLVYRPVCSKKMRSCIGKPALLILISALLITTADSSDLLPQSRLQKEMTQMLENPVNHSRIAKTRWSAFGRVDLVETDNPLFKTMFIDGAAGTKMIQMESGKVSSDIAETLLYQYMGGVPLLAVEKDNKDLALVIGSGGGIDVVTLLLAGYREIEAIEINPDFIEVVKEEKAYNGGIYTENPQVTLIEGEGRSYIRNSDKEYNLMLMSLPITKSARNYGNQALTENYLFTRNAFSEYLSKLKPEGFIVIVAHYPNEALKIAVNAVSALMEKGMSLNEAFSQIALIGADSSPAIVIKGSPLSKTESSVLYAIMDTLQLRGSANFIPGFAQSTLTVTKQGSGETAAVPEFHPDLYRASQGEISLEKIVEHSDENIGVVTDSSPFFYQMSKDLPYETTIVLISILSIFLLFIVAFFLKQKLFQPSNHAKNAILQLFSFSAIGLGFMLFEVAYLQKFILYWQHQTLALALVLSIILVSSGLGSLVSGRVGRRQHFAAAILILLALQILSLLIIEPILKASSDLSGGIKFIISSALLFPVFFLMGIPFPTLLKRNEQECGGRLEFPWMIGINSVASLAGGVVGMGIAMKFGYPFVGLSGILCYGLLLLFIFAVKDSEPQL